MEADPEPYVYRQSQAQPRDSSNRRIQTQIKGNLFLNLLDIVSCNEIDQRMKYLVEILIKLETTYEVIGNAKDKTILCSYRMFEIMGVLCRHILKLFNIWDLKQIPNHYIL